MKFFCETYHEERDTEHCGFCSAACSQRPVVETATGTGEHNKKGEIITGKTFIQPLLNKVLVTATPLTEEQENNVIAKAMRDYGGNSTVKIVHFHCYVPMLEVSESLLETSIAYKLAELIKDE